MRSTLKKFISFLSMFILTIVFNSLSIAAEGIVVTDSGLKYQDLKIGAGSTADVGRIAVVHLTGWLDDNGQKGKEFICSHNRGKPASFKLGTDKVMQGWNIGVDGMKVGGKRRLMIPSYLGYGKKGVDEVVPPNADLIFEVELLEVK
jgi:FKBP-type peptidyl-prolyl cis-trans isomerase